MSAFAAAAAAALASVALLAAGCGGANTPTVASLAPTSSTSSTTQGSTAGSSGTGFVAFADCMNAHGAPVTVGADGHGVQISGDPGSSQFQAAQEACRKLLPGGGPPELTPAEEAERAKGLALFAGCMRKHGLPSFPDPNGQGQLPFAAISQLDPSSPLVQSAYKACESLFPKLGPQLRL